MRLRKRVAAVRSWIAIKTISLAILPAVANAQAAEPVQDEVCADDIIVTGTVVDVRLRQGASEISAGRVVELSSDSIADALAFEPSVNATPRYGVVDQLFLTIRGSGRQRRPSARGLSILIDDVPINRGDNSFILGLVNPNSFARIELFPGPRANELAPFALGGTLALHSTAPRQMSEMRISAGELGYHSVSARLRTGNAANGLTAMGSLSRLDNVRGSERDSAELAWNGPVADWSFLGRLEYIRAQIETAGPLNWDRLADDPQQLFPGPVVTRNASGVLLVTQPGPNIVRDRPYRNTRQLRALVRAERLLGSGSFVIGAALTHNNDTSLSPIAGGARLTNEATGSIRMMWRTEKSAERPGFDLSGYLISSDGELDYRHNDLGRLGEQIGAFRTRTATVAASAGVTFELTPRLDLQTSVAFGRGYRQIIDRFEPTIRPTLRVGGPPPGPLPPRVAAPDVDFVRGFNDWSAHVGLIYRLGDVRLHASVSRRAEAPILEDLITVSGGTFNSGPTGIQANPLQSQTAVDIELGMSGRLGAADFELSAYQSRFKGEVLIQVDQNFARVDARNAERTVVDGIEAATSFRLANNLSGRLAYAYESARFRSDPVYGNNRLAGSTPHRIEAEIAFRRAIGPIGSISARIVPEGRFVDNANLTSIPGYALFEAMIGWQFKQRYDVRLIVFNMFDERYAVDATPTDRVSVGQAVFFPGEPRAARLVLRAAF